MRQLKADLELFKQLVSEFETSLKEAYEFRDDETTEKSIQNYYTFVLKMSKPLGALASINNETTLLASDLNKITQKSIVSFVETPDDAMKSVISTLGEYSHDGVTKKNSGNNNTN